MNVYCPGTDCPLKDQCERVKEINPVVDFHFPNPPFKNKKCEFFIKIETNESDPPQVNGRGV